MQPTINISNWYSNIRCDGTTLGFKHHTIASIQFVHALKEKLT